MLMVVVPVGMAVIMVMLMPMVMVPVGMAVFMVIFMPVGVPVVVIMVMLMPVVVIMVPGLILLSGFLSGFYDPDRISWFAASACFAHLSICFILQEEI
jgi:hypothetical protein